VPLRHEFILSSAFPEVRQTDPNRVQIGSVFKKNRIVVKAKVAMTFPERNVGGMQGVHDPYQVRIFRLFPPTFV
jgi:hypothetical protein